MTIYNRGKEIEAGAHGETEYVYTSGVPVFNEGAGGFLQESGYEVVSSQVTDVKVPEFLPEASLSLEWTAPGVLRCGRSNWASGYVAGQYEGDDNYYGSDRDLRVYDVESGEYAEDTGGLGSGASTPSPHPAGFVSRGYSGSSYFGVATSTDVMVRSPDAERLAYTAKEAEYKCPVEYIDNDGNVVESTTYTFTFAFKYESGQIHGVTSQGSTVWWGHKPSEDMPRTYYGQTVVRFEYRDSKDPIYNNNRDYDMETDLVARVNGTTARTLRYPDNNRPTVSQLKGDFRAELRDQDEYGYAATNHGPPHNDGEDVFDPSSFSNYGVIWSMGPPATEWADFYGPAGGQDANNHTSEAFGGSSLYHGLPNGIAINGETVATYDEMSNASGNNIGNVFAGAYNGVWKIYFDEQNNNLYAVKGDDMVWWADWVAGRLPAVCTAYDGIRLFDWQGGRMYSVTA